MDNRQSQATVPVTVENFTRAESDLYFGNFLKLPGAKLGEFSHIVRLYRPRPAILNGTCKFPEAQKVS